MATLRLFAQAREAAGAKTAQIDGSTVGEVLDAAVASYGDQFSAVLGQSNVWLNGEPAERSVAVADNDEVAVLPAGLRRISGRSIDARAGPRNKRAAHPAH